MGSIPGLIDGRSRTPRPSSPCRSGEAPLPVPRAASQRGYTPFGIETAKGAPHHDLKEFWHVGRELPPGHPYGRGMPDNVWPGEVPGFREHVRRLYAALEPWATRLLRAIARYLGLPDGYFDADHRRRQQRAAAAALSAGVGRRPPRAGRRRTRTST